MLKCFNLVLGYILKCSMKYLYVFKLIRVTSRGGKAAHVSNFMQRNIYYEIYMPHQIQCGNYNYNY